MNAELTMPLSNRDPQNTRTDAELLDALRRAWLLPKEGIAVDPTTEAKFSLDSAVNDEGMCPRHSHFPLPSALILRIAARRIKLQRG